MELQRSDFYYNLPEELIAQTPIERREMSRLMCLDRRTGDTAHRRFFELPELLRPGDCLVLNNSRVIPARLHGERTTHKPVVAGPTRNPPRPAEIPTPVVAGPTRNPLRPAEIPTPVVACTTRTLPQPAETVGIPPAPGPGVPRAVEVVLLRDLGGDTWECLARPGKKTRPGTELAFGDGELAAIVTGVTDSGTRLIRFRYSGVFLEILERLGQMPLPPYIREKLGDAERYQTVYSSISGSAAAPTAGLHFTRELLDEASARGIHLCYLTLHVGIGTFRPVKADRLEEHRMHSEYYSLTDDAAETLNRAKAGGGRIIAVGTTSCRTLESCADESGKIRASSGFTDIFIYPGYNFKFVDGLVTNFHLPESTLIMLVSALSSRENVLRAYSEAIRERYRFFSFGDAMLIL